MPKHNKLLEIIHFNDVYNIEETEDSGPIKAGAARFVTALDQYNSKDKLVIFSGDVFSPSNLSTFYEGEQMVLPFNRMNVDISCLGNHELDFGIEKAEALIKKTNCPWILSNLVETDKNDRPMAGVLKNKVLEIQNFKIGFLGFAEEAWIDQLTPEIHTEYLKYIDYNQVLREQSKILKKEEKCDLIVAINHMRAPEDKDMAEKNSTDIVDMIFGGHDHSYISELNSNTNVYIQKSGTDFEVFTNLTVLFGVDEQEYTNFAAKLSSVEHGLNLCYSQKLQRLYICEKVYITERFEPDYEIQQHVNEFTEKVN